MGEAAFKVLVTAKLPDAIESRLGDLFDTELTPEGKRLGHAELIAKARDVDVLAATLGDQLDAGVFRQGG